LDHAKAGKAVDSLRAVARAAAMQCHRPDLPVVEDVTDLAVLASAPGTALADRDGAPPALDHPTVLVGPEGGWAPEERARAAARVRVADHVLRAETAAVTVGAVLAALRGAVVGPAAPAP
jgi:16S rRNA (uracil1498-N3)-methyltransferase